MKTLGINNLVSPESFYSLWGMPSRAEVVAFLVFKYGRFQQSVSVDEADKLIESNAVKSENGYRSTFACAGLRFNFIDEWLDMKEFPAEAVLDLEKMKELKCEWYAYLKSILNDLEERGIVHNHVQS